MLIHGAFVTNKTWDDWKSYYEDRGYRVLAPAWPYKDAGPVELRRRQPDADVASIRLKDLVAHYEKIVSALPERPVLIGHSLGGLLVQLLIQKNLGEAGIAIHSVPPQGVMTFKLSFFRSTFHPLGFFTSVKQSHLMSFAQWQYAFTNGLSFEDQARSYDEHVVPESKLVLRDGLTSTAKIDFGKPHAPLLFISGSDDHIMPASLNLSNYKAYHDKGSVTDYKQFEGRNHFVLGLPTWKQEADFILGWLNGDE